MLCLGEHFVKPGSLRGSVWRKKDGAALRSGHSVNEAPFSDHSCNTIHWSELVEVLFGSECTTLQTEHTEELEGNVVFLQLTLLAELGLAS